MNNEQVKRGMKVQIDYFDKLCPRCNYSGIGTVLRKALKHYGPDCWWCKIEGGEGVFHASKMKEVK